MFGWVSKLLVLLSVLLMPLAMSSASAAAPSHGGTPGVMTMEHCPDEGSPPELSPGIAACSMACAAALPAFATAVGEQMAPGAPPRGGVEPRALAGVNPESADPPPRLS